MDIKTEKKYLTRNIYLIIFFITIYFSSIMGVFAQGDLLIFPKRIELEGRKRVEQIILANTGKDTAIYNISFKQYRMTETGDFVTITEPDLGQHFATPFLRVYPRRVNLAPGESQTVKVQKFNTDKMEDGEYRSHLYFRAERNNKPLGQDNEEKASNTISVKLEAVYGISIATIIRKGTSNTEISVSEPTYNNDGVSNHFLNFNINRTGNMSSYGDITVNYISLENKIYEVGKVKGLAVYTPGNVRKVKMQLQKPENINFNSGKFKVVYTENESNTIIAEAELQL